MNKVLKYLVLYMVSSFFFACEEEEIPYIQKNDQLYIGYWEDSGFTDSTNIFKRKKDLAESTYAFAILADGTFLENKNSGWCGTPPINYARYEGSWLEVARDTLLISTEFWGGNMTFNLIIKYVDEETMEVVMEYLDLKGNSLR